LERRKVSRRVHPFRGPKASNRTPLSDFLDRLALGPCRAASFASVGSSIAGGRLRRQKRPTSLEARRSMPARRQSTSEWPTIIRGSRGPIFDEEGGTPDARPRL
jgi:hypothetical protein